MQKLRVIRLTESWIAIDKPAGILVHPPRDFGATASRGRPDVIRILRNQLGQYVYPVHRLDRATSGVMIVARSSEAAAHLQKKFTTGEVKKTYLALVRGWLDEAGTIETPLKDLDFPEKTQEAKTKYQTLFRFELPIQNTKHPTSRYSLMKVMPVTGRTHQIRRHFKHLSHPLIGDTMYGDGQQNRIWRELTGESCLYLRSWKISFLEEETVNLFALFNGHWHRVFDRAGFCPLWKSIVHE